MLAVIALPGVVGAFVGAVILTAVASNAARLWMACILFVLGLVIIARFGFGRSLLPEVRARTRHLWPVGLVGGFVDATGGGGWGPVATPSLLTLTRHEPHRVVGTVNAAEFFVAVSASAGFLFGAGESGVPWLPVLGLVVGGALVAPVAARLARRAPTAILGVCVGGMVLVSNTAVISKVLGVPGAVASLLILVIIVTTGGIALRAHRAAGRSAAAMTGADEPAPLR